MTNKSFYLVKSLNNICIYSTLVLIADFFSFDFLNLKNKAKTTGNVLFYKDFFEKAQKWAFFA